MVDEIFFDKLSFMKRFQHISYVTPYCCDTRDIVIKVRPTVDKIQDSRTNSLNILHEVISVNTAAI